jgi:hypothetical protein
VKRSRGVLLLLLSIAVAFAATLAFAPSQASPGPVSALGTPASLLQLGSAGPRVAGLQWLLGGHRPSAYLGVSTYQGKPTGAFDEPTAAAVVAMKKRLGFPRLEPVAGRDLLEILTGKRARPLGYLVRATRLLAEEKQIAADSEPTRCANRLIDVERSQLGVHEVPLGSNDGPQVHAYQEATGAYRAAWCASFQAWAYRLTHVGFPSSWDGFIGATRSDSAGVFAIVRNAQARGWLRAKPRPGFLVAFMDRLGHIGLVERVFYSGILSIEGNASDSVLRRWHPYGSRPVVYIAIPGCDGG